MIVQENIPYTEDEIKAMVETIAHLREENKAYEELAKMNEKHFRELQNSIVQLRQPINSLKDLWHNSEEQPTRQINSKYIHYALCLLWYDGWHAELCKINKDGTFTDSKGDIWNKDNNIFTYWSYVEDLIPTDLGI